MKTIRFFHVIFLNVIFVILMLSFPLAVEAREISFRIVEGENITKTENNNEIRFKITENGLFTEKIIAYVVYEDFIESINSQDEKIILLSDGDGDEQSVMDNLEHNSDNRRLTASLGVVYGPSGRETWYNLPMEGVIEIMRNMGFTEEEHPFWIREDGCKMLGDYIMVAANHEIRPRGSLLETSLGTGRVCDTGAFVLTDPTGVDIAVDW